jgi:hypothetical protein
MSVQCQNILPNITDITACTNLRSFNITELITDTNSSVPKSDVTKGMQTALSVKALAMVTALED